jgi:hypothetical protein
LDDRGVCCHPRTFGEQDHVAAYDISTSDADSLTVADHQRTRAGEIT